MATIQHICVLAAVLATFAVSVGAQAAPSDVPTTSNPQPNAQHRFWNTENKWLFTGVAASRTLDYFSTLNMRRRGRDEILLNNGVVDNHAAFATIEAAGTGVSIGASYLFHRYGHHRLERWASIVHISLTTTGAVRNYSLVTRHYVPGGPLEIHGGAR